MQRQSVANRTADYLKPLSLLRMRALVGEFRFKPTNPGEKTHDLDVEKDGKQFAVECKRMEGGEFAEAERARMRELWRVPCMGLVQKEQRSTYLDVRFKIQLAAVPDDYLLRRTIDFLKSGMPARLWDDHVGSGVIGDLDLNPIQEVLKTNSILHPGPVFNKLLTGSYRRFDSMIEAGRLKYAKCPHYVDALDLAVVARWSSLSEAAIDKKARDIEGKLVEANRQLPADVPGVIHIGFEALSGDLVEQRRYDEIIDRAFAFDRDGSRLEFIYCHYFAPEATPDEVWAIDETLQWMANDRHQNRRPLQNILLLLPENQGPTRKGVHWGGVASAATVRR